VNGGNEEKPKPEEGEEAAEAVKPVEERLHRKPELTPVKTRLLNVRKRLQKRKPKFRRQESWRYKRVKESWRKPRGGTSKMRLQLKGWPPLPKTGYGKPRAVRGLHPSGYEEVIVHNLEDLEKVDGRTQAARIAQAVGARKRSRIVERAKDLQIVVVNPGPEGGKEVAGAEPTGEGGGGK